MKKLMITILMALCVISLVSAAGQTEPGAKELTTVRIGIHANANGTSLAAVAAEKGFFEKYGIKPVFTIVESGPAEMTAMRSDNRTLDAGFIGAGVAWNPIDGNGNSLSFVFLDGLSNSEMLLAEKGVFTDANGNGKYDNTEIANGLKGKKVYIEVGTTPGGWFKSLLEIINADLPKNEQVWLHSETSSYMAGYNAPNNNIANRVEVVNTLNSNLPAAMASNSGMDVVAGYSPVTNTIIKTNKDVEVIATTGGNFPPEKSFPNTWVASDAWLNENPEIAQNFINALYEALIWRGDNLEESMRIGEIVAQKPTGSFDQTTQVSPTKQMYQTWFANQDALGYKYIKALYDSKVPNVPKGNKVDTFEEAFNDTFLVEALKTIK